MRQREAERYTRERGGASSTCVVFAIGPCPNAPLFLPSPHPLSFSSFNNRYPITLNKATEMNAKMEASKRVYQGAQWPREEIEFMAPFGTRYIGVPGSGADSTGFPGDLPPRTAVDADK